MSRTETHREIKGERDRKRERVASGVEASMGVEARERRTNQSAYVVVALCWARV